MAEGKHKVKIAIYGTGKLANAFLGWIEFRSIEVNITYFVQTDVTNA